MRNLCMDQVGNRMKCWWGEMLKSKATKGVTGSISSFLVWLPWIPYLHICCIHENLDWRRICKKDPKGWPLQKLSIRAELQKHSLNNVRISYNVSTYKKKPDTRLKPHQSYVPKKRSVWVMYTWYLYMKFSEKLYWEKGSRVLCEK